MAKRKSKETPDAVKTSASAKAVADAHLPWISGEYSPDEVVTDDKMFHFILSTPKLAGDAIRRFFPEELAQELDFDRIELHVTEYYDETLKRSVADLVFRIPSKDLSESIMLLLVLEHKSEIETSDTASVIVQGLKYLYVVCQNQALAAEKNKPLEQPIVMIVYTGEKKDLTSLQLSDRFKLPKAFQKYAIPFPHFFVNLTKLSEEGLFAESPFLEAVFAMMSWHDAKQADEALAAVLNPLTKIKPWKEQYDWFLIAIIRYFLSKLKRLRLVATSSRFASFIKPVRDRGDVDMSVVTDYFTPIAEEKGRREAFRATTAANLETIRAVASHRFGYFPNELRDAFVKMSSPDLQARLIRHALFAADSLDDVLIEAKRLGGF